MTGITESKCCMEAPFTPPLEDSRCPSPPSPPRRKKRRVDQKNGVVLVTRSMNGPLVPLLDVDEASQCENQVFSRLKPRLMPVTRRSDLGLRLHCPSSISCVTDENQRPLFPELFDHEIERNATKSKGTIESKGKSLALRRRSLETNHTYCVWRLTCTRDHYKSPLVAYFLLLWQYFTYQSFGVPLLEPQFKDGNGSLKCSYFFVKSTIAFYTTIFCVHVFSKQTPLIGPSPTIRKLAEPSVDRIFEFKIDRKR